MRSAKLIKCSEIYKIAVSALQVQWIKLQVQWDLAQHQGDNSVLDAKYNQIWMVDD